MPSPPPPSNAGSTPSQRRAALRRSEPREFNNHRSRYLCSYTAAATAGVSRTSAAAAGNTSCSEFRFFPPCDVRLPHTIPPLKVTYSLADDVDKEVPELLVERKLYSEVNERLELLPH